jgi:hypothetical protein
MRPGGVVDPKITRTSTGSVADAGVSSGKFVLLDLDL